jgi:Zn-dependent M28 family amino/carboxypeptidase
VDRSTRALLTSIALTLAFVPAAAADHDPMKTSEDLREDVKVSGMRAHLQALQNIATMNGGTRASGTPGYDASAAYVMRRLERAGYEPEQHVFTFKAFEVLSPAVVQRVSPNPRVFVNPDEVAIMSYSGSGDVTAAVTPVDVVIPPGAAANTSTSGCEAADFAGFPAGNIALMQRGTCPFAQKVENAQAAGASAAIVFNEGQPGRDDTLAGTLGEDTTATIPAVGTSFAIGAELAAAGTVMRVATSTKITPTTTSNVTADLAPRRPRGAGKVVLVGAHLDSVPEGPGINDNGSGTAAILETAEEMAKDRPPRNPVRFAFWGAEEAGLVGSTRYVAGLSDEEGAKIGLNLNFDMLGSPNFIRLVYDGDGSAFGTAGPAGSDEIEHVFEAYFAAKGLAADPTAFDGRSDYKPFIDVGIPAGGLFSGAENVKTPEQAERHGGVAGEAFDRCYHQACDTISNVNFVGLRQLSQAAVHAIAVFATKKEPVGATASMTVRKRSARSTRARGTTKLGHSDQR